MKAPASNIFLGATTTARNWRTANNVLVAAVIIVILVTPRVTVTNNCTQDIQASEIFPVVSEVTIRLAAGQSRDYPIPQAPTNSNMTASRSGPECP